jgi:hypothetical protein
MEGVVFVVPVQFSALEVEVGLYKREEAQPSRW